MNNSLRYFLESFRMALRAILRFPLRAGLTAFGIMVGILAVTVTVALGEGARQKVSSQIDKLGSNALLVMPESRARGGVPTTLTPFRESDGQAVLREVPSVKEVAPIISLREVLSFGAGNTNAEVVGTTLSYFSIREWQLALGAFWDAAAEKTGSHVCILGETVRKDLFGTDDPVGRSLRMGRIPLRVVGVLSPKGQDPFGRDEDARILVPIDVARTREAGPVVKRVDSLVFSAHSSEKSEEAQRDIARVLRERRGLAEDAPNDFVVRSQAEFRATQDRIMGILSTLLISVAAVSLVVGGIGIMNIMLVSVSERTKEIGIRLAIGAQESDILLQFLVEAVVLSALGGVLGVATAAGSVWAMGDRLGFPIQISGAALGIALGVSSGVGVVFGLIPARRAARLDPIDALRGE
jgi:putative ABC transport system permease protein